MERIGCAVITCDRPFFFEKCIKSIPKNIDYLVVINDGKESVKDTTKDFEKCNLIEHKINQGVAISKNHALKALMEYKDCQHLFLIEDDMIIKREDVFETYIKAAKKSGILHFNYGPGSPFNRKQDPSIRMDLDTRHLLKEDSEPNPRLIIDYGDNVRIALYMHTVAMFSYFHRDVIDKVDYMDERFSQYQSWEHVEMTQRIANNNMTTPFWWFADIDKSWEYLTEAPEAINKSAIAKNRDEWMKKVMKGRELYKEIHGYYPNCSPLTSEEDVIKFLKNIRKV